MRRIVTASPMVLLLLGFGRMPAGTQPAIGAGATDADVGVTQDFETDSDGWNAADPDMQVSRSTQTKAGKHCLQFPYTVGQGVPAVMWGGPRIAGARGLTFSVRVSAPTVLAIGLAEQNGARYQCALRGGPEWTKVALSLDEFAPEKDAPDDNGQLDTDRVQAFIIIDMMAMLAKGQSVGKQRTLWLDDVTFLKQAPAGATLRPGLVDGFEAGAHRWLPIRGSQTKGQPEIVFDAESRVIADPAAAKVGKFGLRYEYEITPGVFRVLAGPGGRVRRPDGKAIRLWARTSTDTAVVVTLGESDGSEYSASFYSPAQQWQMVDLPLSQFALNEDKPDENNKLDIDEIGNLLIADLSVLFNPKAKPERRTLWLDDVRCVTETPPASRGWADARHRRYVIDSFTNPLINWVPIRVNTDPLEFHPFSGAKLSLVAGSGDSFALQADYATEAATAVGLFRGVTGLPAIPAGYLEIRCKSESDVPMFVMLKESNDAEYQGRVEVKQSKEWQTIKVPLSSLKRKPETADPNDRLDTDQVKELTLADIGFMDGIAGDNVLVIDEIALVKD